MTAGRLRARTEVDVIDIDFGEVTRNTASERGLELTDERAARAAAAGRTAHLRERLTRAPAPDSGLEQVHGSSRSSGIR